MKKILAVLLSLILVCICVSAFASSLSARWEDGKLTVTANFSESPAAVILSGDGIPGGTMLTTKSNSIVIDFPADGDSHTVKCEPFSPLMAGFSDVASFTTPKNEDPGVDPGTDPGTIVSESKLIVSWENGKLTVTAEFAESPAAVILTGDGIPAATMLTTKAPSIVIDFPADGKLHTISCEPFSEKMAGFSATKSFAAPIHTHDYVAVVTEPTCTEKGYTTYTCECGDSYEDDYTDALEHDYVAVVTEPTCTEKGYTTYTCSRCGDTYVANETDALDHDYVAVVTEPTCTEKGYTTYTCSRCGDTYVANETDALDHDWGEWEVTIAPTEEEEGEETQVCKRCGEKNTRPIPPVHLDDPDYKFEVTTCTKDLVVVKITHVEGTKTLKSLRVKAYMVGEGTSYIAVTARVYFEGDTLEFPMQGAFGVSISLYDAEDPNGISAVYGEFFD